MQPTLLPRPFHHEGWVYEEKYDGWRMLAYKDGDRVQLISRPGRDHTRRFPDLVAAIAALRPSTLILDGEVCIFDRQLVSRFEVAGPPLRRPLPRRARPRYPIKTGTSVAKRVIWRHLVSRLEGSSV